MRFTCFSVLLAFSSSASTPISPQYAFGTTFPMMGTQAVSGATWDGSVYLSPCTNCNQGAYFSYTNSYYVPQYATVPPTPYPVVAPTPYPAGTTPGSITATGGTVSSTGGTITTTTTNGVTSITISGGTIILNGGTVVQGNTSYVGGITTITNGSVTNIGGTVTTTNGVTTITGGTNYINSGTVTINGGTTVTTQPTASSDTTTVITNNGGTTISNSGSGNSGTTIVIAGTTGTTTNLPAPSLVAYVGTECQVPGVFCPQGLYCQMLLGYNPYQVGKCQIDPGNYGGTTGSTSYFNTQKGSCRSPSQCGYQSLSGSCWCDKQCVMTGDCCGDFKESCPALQPPAPTPYIAPTPPPTIPKYVAPPTYAPLTYDNTSPAQHGSCTGKCGGRVDTVHGSCYCDPSCWKHGDCCYDIASFCVTVPVAGRR